MAHQLTDFGENKLADFIRNQGITLSANWYLQLDSAADDASSTALTGTGLARIASARSLAAWAGTQGAGTTLASTGTSHTTSNNSALSWGNPGSAWGTASFVSFWDALTGGNRWFYFPITAIVITTGSPNPVQILAGQLAFSIGLTNMGDYLANALIDLLFRGQAYTYPATVYLAAYSTPTTNAGGGTELSVTGYARQAIVPALSSLSGTQTVGSTAASSGTAGRISNNATVTFAQMSASVTNMAIKDAATVGNTLFHGPLTAPLTLTSTGPALTFAPNAIGWTFD